MAETKHTPGPWQLVHLEGSDDHQAVADYQARCTAKGSGPFFIVLCEKPDGPADVAHTGNGPTSYANGLLIAAAPELLEALRFVLAHAFEAKWAGDERALDLVEAAIAKAEGRAP